MHKAQLIGVQALTVKRGDDFRWAVDVVARDRMTDVSEMHADLMGASGLQTAQDIGEAVVPLQHPDMGDGRLGVLLCDAHLLAVGLMPSDRRVDRALVLFDIAVADREVRAGEAVILDLFAESRMRDIGLRDHQKPAGVFIDAVDDAGAQFAVDEIGRDTPELQSRE